MAKENPSSQSPKAPASKPSVPPSRPPEAPGLFTEAFQRMNAAKHQAVERAKVARREATPSLIGRDRFEQVKGMTEEKLSFARNAINIALNKMNTPDTSKQLKLKEKGVVLKDADYYLAFCIKESGLRPEEVSRNNAKGLCQVKTVAGQALDEVNQKFGLQIKPEEVYYKGPDAQKQLAASSVNAAVGILYWHICRDIFPSKQNLSIKPEDRDKATAFAYKLGPASFANLWRELKPASMSAFEAALAAKIKAQFPKKFELPKGGSVQEEDKTYNIKFKRLINATDKFNGNETIKIGNRNYPVANLLETLRYCELIHSLRNLPAIAPKMAENGAEILTPNYLMWSVATKLLTKATDEYKLAYFKDPAKTNTLKIRFLIGVIIDYNIQQGNEAFAEVEPEDENPALAAGTMVYMPTKSFIVAALKEAQAEVPPAPESNEAPESPLPPGSLYAGPEAATLEAQSREVLTYSGKAPKLVIPSYKGKPLDVKLPGKNGVMSKENVKYIILHATEGGGEGLYRTHGIHYLVRKNGTIELIRDESIAIDHAGRWANKANHRGSMAMWNGDGNISLHSVGIEVETDTGVGYNEDQYKTLNDLVHWIGARYKITKGNVLAHSMIGVSNFSRFMKADTLKTATDRDKYVRGRKQDPRNLDWSKLGLPNNYMRIDPDVVAGRVGSNVEVIKAERSEGRRGWGIGTSSGMITGLEAAHKIFEAEKPKPKAKEKP